MKEKALAEMPDLKFVSVPDCPKVIVNDLSSNRSNNGNDTEKKLGKHSNHMKSLGKWFSLLNFTEHKYPKEKEPF